MVRPALTLLGSGLCLAAGWLAGDLFIGILMSLIVALVSFLLIGGDTKKSDSGSSLPGTESGGE